MNTPQLPFEKENCAVIKQEFQSLFTLAKSTWAIALSLIAFDEKVGKGNDTRLNLCAIAVYTKMLRLFLACYRLSEDGLDLEALLIVRAMFETFVNLKAMAESADPEHFAKEWILWDLANDRKLTDGLIERNPQQAEKIKEFNKNLDEQKKEMKESEWNDFVRWGPSRVNLSNLCKKVGLNEAYSVFYPFASGATHGYDILMYATIVEDGGIQSTLSPSKSLVDANLGTAIHTLCDTLQIIASLLHLEKSKELEDLKKIVKTVVGLFKEGEYKA